MEKPERKVSSAYHERNSGEQSHPRLERIVDMFLPDGGKALDLGCSALRDTKILLDKGFEVTEVDGDSETLKYSEAIENEKFHHKIAQFEEFDFPTQEYDLAVAINSLSFIQKDKFDLVFARLKDSVKIGGILYCTFFGNNHEWVKNEKSLFFNEEQVKELFDDFDIRRLMHDDLVQNNPAGVPVHWHNIVVIARRLR